VAHSYIIDRPEDNDKRFHGVCSELRVWQRLHNRKSTAPTQQLIFLDEVPSFRHRLKQRDQVRFQYSRRNLTIPLSSYDL